MPRSVPTTLRPSRPPMARPPSPPCAGPTSRYGPRATTLTTATVPDEGELDVEMRPNTVTGVVTDPDGTPIAGVRVFVDGSEPLTETDEDGAYELPGCRRTEPDLQDARLSAGRADRRRRSWPGTSPWSRSRPARSTRRPPSSRPPGGSTRCSASSTGPRPTRWSSTSRRPMAGSTTPPTCQPPRRSAPSARRRSSTSTSCCRCSRSAASTPSRGWSA